MLGRRVIVPLQRKDAKIVQRMVIATPSSIASNMIALTVKETRKQRGMQPTYSQS